MLATALLCILAVQDDPSFEERLLLTLPEGVSIIKGVVSPNGRAACYFDDHVVVVDGKPSEPYDHVDRPTYSQDGKTLAYIARKGGKTWAVINGNKGEAYPHIESLCLSPDGKTALVKVQTGRNRWAMVAGERKGEEFENVENGVFSPDGSAFAYVASQKNRRFVVIGDQKGEAFEFAGHPVFSPRGDTVAYEARNGQKWCVLVGGKKIAEDLDYVFGPTFTPDGKLLYAANRGGDFGDGDFGQMRVLPPRGGKWFFSIGGEQREVPAGVDAPAWLPSIAPDGKTLFYVAKKGEQECLVVGDQRGPLFGGVGNIGFSADGKSMAYVARLSGLRDAVEESRIVVDGKVGEERFTNVSVVLRMSPDGKAIAIRTSGRNGRQVRLGDQKSEFYTIIDDLYFSPDSRKVAFCARRGREIWWKVMELK